jgi:hypothetical protein
MKDKRSFYKMGYTFISIYSTNNYLSPQPHYTVTEILLKLALNTIVHNPSHLNALKIKIDHNI